MVYTWALSLFSGSSQWGDALTVLGKDLNVIQACAGQIQPWKATIIYLLLFFKKRRKNNCTSSHPSRHLCSRQDGHQKQPPSCQPSPPNPRQHWCRSILQAQNHKRGYVLSSLPASFSRSDNFSTNSLEICSPPPPITHFLQHKPHLLHHPKAPRDVPGHPFLHQYPITSGSRELPAPSPPRLPPPASHRLLSSPITLRG